MARIGKTGAVATTLIAALSLLAAWLAWWWWGDDGPRLPTETSVSAPDRPDALPELVLLAPGTVLDSETPKGWSDPIIKSVMHLESGDIETLPKFARATATRFKTVILADVRRDPAREAFRLRRV